ncbi:MAG: succinate dehydrogenase, cytochrome b556 subunit [Caulobacteraceae bacterium]
MAAGEDDRRPISPGLGVWRWHLTMAASILNRATGAGLYLAFLVLAGWAVALALGPGPFAAYAGAFGSVPGRIALILLTLAAFFHLAAGIRHLLWDFGQGFAPAAATTSAWIAFLFAGLATAGAWAWAASAGLL